MLSCISLHLVVGVHLAVVRGLAALVLGRLAPAGLQAGLALRVPERDIRTL